MDQIETADEVRWRARRLKQSLSQAAGEAISCDCKRCYNLNIERPIATVKTHRARYGRHVSPPRASPARHSPPEPNNLPTQLGEDADEDMLFDDGLVPGSPLRAQPLSRAGSGSRVNSVSGVSNQSRSGSGSRSRSRSRSRLLSRSRSRSRSIRSDPPNRSPSRSSNENDNENVILRAVELNEDEEFYRNLLGGNEVHQPPPLHVHVDHDAGDQMIWEGNVEEDVGRDEDRGGNNGLGDAIEGLGDGGEPDGGDPGADEAIHPQHNAEIFVPPPEVGHEPDPPNEDEWSAAFNEHPTLRNIYLRTWIRAAFFGATHDDIQAILESHKLSLESMSRITPLPDDLLHDLEKMPRTLRALERRIGMDFSDLVTTYALCPDCGKRYSSEHLNNLRDPQCIQYHDQIQCEGAIYSINTLADGTQKRTPARTYPYVHLHTALGRLLSRPGIAELMQHWRREGDEPDEAAEPRQWDDWVDNMPQDHRFGDMAEGWGWRAQMAGLERTYDGEVYGDDPTGPRPLSLSRQPLGLNLGLNMDGFRAFRGKYSVNGSYSVNGVYIVVNNLPFYLRTLIENMLLVMVIPGPQEPKGYAMDEILKPLVDDIIQLTQGVELPVYNMQTGQVEPRMVYATLSCVIVDWQARIKCTGHVGLGAEFDHCLYCKMRKCFLSLERGYHMTDYDMRNPHEHLQLKHEWLRAPRGEQEGIRVQNGTRFVEFDRIPTFFSFDNTPIDGMHLFDHGITPAIVREIVYSTGMLARRFPRQQPDQTPEARFDAFIERTYFPSHCGRLPPKIENMSSRMKADQWRTLLVVLLGALFDAWRVGDAIPEGMIPRGNRNTKHYQKQRSNAASLLQRRLDAHLELDGDPNDPPTLDDCASSREPREYFLNILRYCVAYQRLFRHRITRAEVEEMQGLLEQVGKNFTRMNIPLIPSFHCATHLGEHLLKYGNVFGTWMYHFEQANRYLINVNTNAHGQGTLETTMAKGWLRRTESFRLVRRMQEIENPTEDDIATTKVLLAAMRDGPEHERQRGMLNAVLAGEVRFQEQQSIRLAKAPAKVDFRHRDHAAYYQLVIDFCSNLVENAVFYGLGRRPPGGIYFQPNDTTLSYSHFFRSGIRYGSALHHRGKRSRYGYINERIPVIVRRIYEATFLIDREERKFLAVVVQRFVRARRRPVFPWSFWENILGIDAWVFNELGPLEVVRASDFNGVFALSDIELTYGHYWLTFAMLHTEPEDLGDD